MERGGLPAHLRLTFRVIGDSDGAPPAVAPSRRAPTWAPCAGGTPRHPRRRGRGRRRGRAARGDLVRRDRQLPRTREQHRPGGTVTAHLALVDTGHAVDVRVFDSAARGARRDARGTRRLLRLASSPAKSLVRSLDNRAVLRLRGAMTAGQKRGGGRGLPGRRGPGRGLRGRGGRRARRHGRRAGVGPRVVRALRAHVAARLPAAAAEVLSRAESVLGEAGPVELAIDQLGARSVGPPSTTSASSCGPGGRPFRRAHAGGAPARRGPLPAGRAPAPREAADRPAPGRRGHRGDAPRRERPTARAGGGRRRAAHFDRDAYDASAGCSRSCG